jgi:hypothetical protein
MLRLSNVVWIVFILVVSWSIYAHIKINSKEKKLAIYVTKG